MIKRFNKDGVPNPKQFLKYLFSLSQINIPNKIKSGGMS